MTKQEMAGYLSSLIAIIRDKEDAARPIGETLSWEYERIYYQLREQLGKEKEDEAKNDSRREKDRA